MMQSPIEIQPAAPRRSAAARLILAAALFASAASALAQQGDAKAWKTGVEPAADAFSFTPPAGAEKLSPDALIEFDELPPGAPAGGSQ